eukprot:s5143_g1.t1
MAALRAANGSLAALLRKAQWPQAIDLLRQMPANQVEPSVVSFNTTVAACARGAAWSLSIELLSAMRSSKVYPNIKTFGACVSAAERASHWVLALELLRKGCGCTRSSFSVEGRNRYVSRTVAMMAQVLLVVEVV